MHVSNADIQKVKQLARSIRKTHPDKKLMQCRSIAAHDLFGLVSFAELEKLREESRMEKIVVLGELEVFCPVCGEKFNPSQKEALKSHRDWHDRYEEAAVALGYWPQHEDAIEVIKEDGRRRLREATEFIDQLDGALMVLRAWFDRSLRSAIRGNYWKKHPGFDHYISLLGGDYGFSPLVNQAIVDRYGITQGDIPKGKTYWCPPRK